MAKGFLQSPVTVRFTEKELRAIDQIIRRHLATREEYISRAAVVRRAVQALLKREGVLE